MGLLKGIILSLLGKPCAVWEGLAATEAEFLDGQVCLCRQIIIVRWWAMLRADDTLTVIIDVQERLLDHMHEASELRANAARLIEGCGALGVPVGFTEQYPEGLGPTVEELRRLLDGCQSFEKKVFSCWRQNDFQKWLAASGRKSVILAGIEAHVCVYQTARDLADNGFHVEVAADAVSSRRPENRDVALAKLQMKGVDLTSTEMALFELLGEAKGEAFKTVNRLVR